LVSRGVIPTLTSLPPLQSLSSFNIFISPIKPFASGLTVSSTLAYALLAYHACPGSRLMYTLAALLSLSAVPYTLFVMHNVYAVILAIENHGNGGKEGETARALEQWGAFNYGRAMMPLSAGIVGLWAALL
jgi:Anthrone oxygenase